MEERTDLTTFADTIRRLKEQVSTVIVGQDEAVDLLLTSVIANGHVLLEGVPGIAKTLLAKLMARLLDVRFSRIQFTPDLMPSDVLGTSVFNVKTSEFEFHAGPVFSDVVLVDEINRAPAKTQAALFEVMEERQVTIDGVTRKMGEVYTVLATQNPVEQEGTYRLPEAQLDRFLMKIVMGYPTVEEETAILQRHQDNIAFNKLTDIKPLLSGEELTALRQQLNTVVAVPALLHYIASFIALTRTSRALLLGASPRASVGILQAAKAQALMGGRDFVTPDDVKHVVVPVLQHRLMLTAEAEMEGLTTAKVITKLLDKVEVPQ